MFQNRMKRRAVSGRLFVLPAIVVALLLAASTVFAFSTVQAQGTAAGDYCVEGIVIDWEEQPLGGWTVNLQTPSSGIISKVSETDDDEDEGTFEFEAPDDMAAEPGLYTASIDVQPGWAGVTPTSFDFNIEAGRDGCVRIRFKMKQEVQVTVFKIDSDHNPLPGWTIDAIPGPGNLFAEPQDEETGVDGSAVFTLTPGIWIFSERQPEPANHERPDSYNNVLPPSGRHQLEVRALADGDPPYIVVFKNEFKNNGCVVIRKMAVGFTPEVGGTGFLVPTDITGQQLGYGAGGWGFQLLTMDGKVARDGVTDAEGYLKFDHLPYGPYVIVEEDRPGWAENTARAIEVNVTSGECVTQTFENIQDDSGFCIEGYKLDANGLYGIPNWEIEAKPLAAGGYEPDNVFTDGMGKYVFNFPANDYRIPGAEYEICEDDDVDGWLPHTPTCQVVKLPLHPGACVKALDFVNQQVGHSESLKHNDGPKSGGKPAMGCKFQHVVKNGEGLFSIGAQYGVSPQAMVDANPSVRSNNDFWVYVGQTLCIP